MTAVQSSFLAGGGELGALIESKDWSGTALGPIERWPRALKTAVRIMLTSRQPMFVWWGDELINIYNDAYKAIVGGKHPEALGQPAHVVWHEIWDQIGPRAQSAMFRNEGTYDEAMLLIMERHGYPEETHYTFSYSPVPDDEGGTGGIFCANTEDTQRILNERQLGLLKELAANTADARTIEGACAASARSLETNLYDLPFAMIYLLDEDRRGVHLAGASGINAGHPAAPERIAEEDAAPWPLDDVFRTNAPCVVDELTGFADLPTGAWNRPPGRAAVVPIALAGQSGSAGVLIAGLNPFRLLDDSYEGFLKLIAGSVSAAIANAQAYEAERKRAEALAELDQVKTAFFSNVSHEFRTPLTLLLGPLEEVLAKPEAEVLPDNRALIDTAHRNGLRLLKLVNSLLDFSRIEAGRIKASFQATDLSALTADLSSSFRSAIEKAGLEYRVECAQLPHPVYVDRDMWEKIVLNLISNAFKFTFAGEIAIRLKASAGNAGVDLEVCDTGTGIAKDELPKLFERFHRVEGAQGRTHEGTGIGLALVQELVKLHGGTVTVESEPGHGSVFRVSIPFGKAHIAPEQLSDASGGVSSKTQAAAFVEEALRWLPDDGDHDGRPHDLSSRVQPGASGSRILLADDNADMRDYVRRILGPEFAVQAVSNGLEALAAAMERPPDLVISDVMMPGLDGFGLIKALREAPATRTVPVILLSARAGEESRIEGLEAGADDYLVKPFMGRELVARIATHLTMSRLRKEGAALERELRQEAEASREQLVSILENLNEGFASFDRDWRFTYVNAAAERIDNMTREQMLGRTFWEIFPGLRGTVAEASYRLAMADGLPLHLEYEYAPWNRWFDARAYPSNGGLALFFQDITERKQAETALRTSNEALRRANADLEQFAYSASHDLQEPLRIVVTHTQLLKRRYAGLLGEDADEIIQRCVDGGIRMERLIGDLLEYTRASAPFVRPEEPTKVEEVLEEVLSNLAPSIGEAGVELAHDPMPPVRAVAVHLKQIFQNLVGNAVKYRSPAQPRIHVGCRRKDNEWLFSVADNGIGIDPQYHVQVFALFKRLHSSSEYSGTGLGLAICKRLVERYGGRIWVESKRGEGATFYFTLPD